MSQVLMGIRGAGGGVVLAVDGMELFPSFSTLPSPDLPFSFFLSPCFPTGGVHSSIRGRALEEARSCRGGIGLSEDSADGVRNWGPWKL